MYFAWGETQGYKYGEHDFTNENYEHKDDRQKLVNSSLILKPEYDAATVNWGPDWRMPTYEEIEALYMNTYAEPEIIDGVECTRVTSMVEGYTDKSLFLKDGSYWSSRMNQDSGDRHADILTSQTGTLEYNFTDCYHGLLVHPVRNI